MSLLTLRVSIKDERKIVYVLLSLDPNVRFETSEIEHVLAVDFEAVSSRALTDVEQCLRVGSKARLEKVGGDLAKAVLPDLVLQALSESKDSYLYLDLEDGAVSFPWECIRVGEIFLGRKFKVGRHIRVVDGGRSHTSASDRQRYVIIANPDGSLKDAALEGDLLREQLQMTGEVDLLNTNVSVNEACELMSSRDIFHFAGHSTATGLRFCDRDLTADDIAALPTVPRMVFLNSCDSGGLRAWSDVSQSIVRAFLQAGSRAVVAASSPIASDHAATCARHFYDGFLKEESLGDSLASAANHETDELAWARYVVFGHPEFKLTRETLKPKKAFSSRALIGAALAAVVVVLSGTLIWKFLSQRTLGLTEAERVSEELCNQGETIRCIQLGEAFAKHEKHREAIKYFVKACDLGSRQSCVALAESYLIVGNIDSTRKLTQTYCMDGDESCGKLADSLREHGVSDLALKIFEKRCSKSDGLACTSAGLFRRELGDIDGAMQMNIKGCKLGFRLSCVQVGYIWTRTGDFDKAVKLLSMLCTLDESEGACIYLGSALMEQGKTKLALSAYRKGCKRPTPTAAIDCEVAAAVLYQKNKSEAVEFYRKSCDFGSATSCAKLASIIAAQKNACGDLNFPDCYQIGFKFQKSGDLDRADRIYRHLCDGGDIQRCNDVAAIQQLRGDAAAAKRAFKDACDKKVGLSCFNLGTMVESEGSISDALDLFKKGCDMGSGQSCTQAAALLQRSANVKESEVLLIKGCNLEDATGCNNLGFLKNKNNDKEGARTEYKKACDLGLSLGCRNLAIILKELGNTPEARSILSSTCNKGDVLSCDLLKTEGFGH